MGKRSVRRRKAKIKAYQAEHNISKHTTAARAVDGQQEQPVEMRFVLGDIQRGGAGKTSVETTIPLPDTTIGIVDLAVTTGKAWWLSSAVKGSTRKSDLPLLLDSARRYANENQYKPVVVDTDTTGSTIASLVITWLVHGAQSDDPERITDWLAQRHGRVLTAAQHAVLDGLVSDPALRRALGQPDPDQDPAAYLGLLDGGLDGTGLANLAVWPGADGVTSRQVVQLLERWEAAHGPLAVGTASATNSVPCLENLTFRRVAAILISWVIEVAGSDDPQRIAGCLPEFDLVLTAGQRATLAELVADSTLRVVRDATRTVLSPETYLALLSSVLFAPHPGHAGNALAADEARDPASRGPA